jgi:hypothetical protein
MDTNTVDTTVKWLSFFMFFCETLVETKTLLQHIRPIPGMERVMRSFPSQIDCMLSMIDEDSWAQTHFDMDAWETHTRYMILCAKLHDAHYMCDNTPCTHTKMVESVVDWIIDDSEVFDTAAFENYHLLTTICKPPVSARLLAMLPTKVLVALRGNCDATPDLLRTTAALIERRAEWCLDMWAIPRYIDTATTLMCVSRRLADELPAELVMEIVHALVALTEGQ